MLTVLMLPIERPGGGMKIPYWKAEITRDCPRRRSPGLADAFAAQCPETAADRVTMAKPPTPASIAAALTVPERVLLFCVAAGTDWVTPPSSR